MNSRVEIVPTETITAAAVTWVEIAPAVTTVEATLAIYQLRLAKSRGESLVKSNKGANVKSF